MIRVVVRKKPPQLQQLLLGLQKPQRRLLQKHPLRLRLKHPETPTSTATETATMTSTPTSTLVPFQRLSVEWLCVEGQQMWTITITNPNGFPVEVNWSFSSGPLPGNAVVPANSSINFYTAGGYWTITVSWNDGENKQSISSMTSQNSPCALNEKNTPTPTSIGGNDPTSTPKPTFVATLEAAIDPLQELLIPVTGADFSNPFKNMPLNSLFLNLGFVFLGVAFLTHGVSFRLK